VNSKRINKVAGDKNEYILDYLIQLDGNIIALKKYKNEYYISLEGIDTVYIQQKLNYPKPKKIGMDCYGNIQLFCKDSVRQFWIDKTILCLYTYSYKSYNEILKPLIYCDGNSVIAGNFINHNKKYQITLKEKGIPKKLIYQTWDKEAEKVAEICYYEIIAHYYATCGPINLIKDGMWDKNLVALQTDFTSMVMIQWYLKIRGREMNIQSFYDSKGIVLFDLQEDSILKLSSKGKTINKTSTDIKTINLSTKIIKDKLLNKYYFHQGDKAWLYLHEINPTTGNTNQILKLKEVTFVKNIKVHNSYVYFVRAKKNGFQKLYRVKL
jgi:hypothetical protein